VIAAAARNKIAANFTNFLVAGDPVPYMLTAALRLSTSVAARGAPGVQELLETATILITPTGDVPSSALEVMDHHLANAAHMLEEFQRGDVLWPLGSTIVLHNSKFEYLLAAGEPSDVGSPAGKHKDSYLHNIAEYKKRIRKLEDSGDLPKPEWDRNFHDNPAHMIRIVQLFEPRISHVHVVHTDRNRAQVTVIGTNLESVIRPLVPSPPGDRVGLRVSDGIRAIASMRGSAV
jgi:hypothetical protein